MISEELLAMSVEDLNNHLTMKKDEMTNLRFQKALQQLENSESIGKVRREIARIKTLLHEYELGRREVKA